jgi:hypothetical protein
MTTATAARPAAIRPLARPTAPVVGVRTVAPHVSIAEVCDLLAAAGPLTGRDIAGGLAISERCAAARIRQMVNHDCLHEDEFGRYRLWGDCAPR